MLQPPSLLGPVLRRQLKLLIKLASDIGRHVDNIGWTRKRKEVADAEYATFIMYPRLRDFLFLSCAQLRACCNLALPCIPKRTLPHT
jgi:hypothetical protein